jgi:hypothetical protein
MHLKAASSSNAIHFCHALFVFVLVFCFAKLLSLTKLEKTPHFLKISTFSYSICWFERQVKQAMCDSKIITEAYCSLPLLAESTQEWHSRSWGREFTMSHSVVSDSSSVVHHQHDLLPLSKDIMVVV